MELSESLAALLFNLLPPVKTSELQLITQQPFLAEFSVFFLHVNAQWQLQDARVPQGKRLSQMQTSYADTKQTHRAGVVVNPSVDRLCCRALHWVTIQMLCVSMEEEIPEVSENVVKAITGGENDRTYHLITLTTTALNILHHKFNDNAITVCVGTWLHKMCSSGSLLHCWSTSPQFLTTHKIKANKVFCTFNSFLLLQIH